MAISFDKPYDGNLEYPNQVINANDANGTIAIQVNGTDYIYVSGGTDVEVQIKKTLVVESGVVATPTTTALATYNTTKADYIINVDPAVSGTTVNLDANAPEGTIFLVVDGSGGAGTDNITIDTEGTEVIYPGGTTVVIAVNYGYAKFMLLNGNYVLLESRLT